MATSLSDRFTQAQQEGNLSEVISIITELNSLDPSLKKTMLSLYEQIGEELFAKSMQVSNYDLTEFKKSISNTKPTTQKKVSSKKEPIVEDNFEEVFLNFLSKTNKICLYLKAHFLFLLDNNSDSKTSLIILTDETNFTNPLLQRIVEQFTHTSIENIKLSDFILNCKKDPEITNKKILCLMTMSPNVLLDGKMKDNLKELFDLFKKSSHIKLKKDESSSRDDYSLSLVDDSTLEHIENICSKVFNNRDITFEEEIIIKKLFSRNTPIIDYKILKGGFSGSKVIETQPIKALSPLTGRFVIKYAKKDLERKISKERQAFKEFIDEYNIGTYKSEYAETDIYEAIKYTYASSDSRTDSYPFASLVKNLVKGKPNTFSFDEILDQLFNCQPFQIWRGSKSTALHQVKDLYSNYLEEEKILDTISKIDALTVREAENSILWTNYKIIKNQGFQTSTKVCHGDLHTENFFKDNSGVYLIDFGYTDIRHSVIDHTTLEASLKFKHIPFYIPISELLSIENTLMNPETFHSGFDLSFITRETLREIYRWVLTVRVDAAKYMYDDKNPFDYWISLFLISLRQILYPDLNQRFAYEYAVALSNKILGTIG